MEFYDPMLLTVKMFLAEFPWIRHKKYEYPLRVCTHFTKEVVDKATSIGMRCACAIVNFANSNLSHAIVAFQTDYGLIYIEPQTGNQEPILVGKRYPSKLQGVPEDCIVNSIELIWNDERILKWLICQNENCGYTLPTRAITDYCPACGSTNTKLETPY